MPYAHREQIERACTRLIHQYAYLNDARDVAGLVQLFTEDAVLYRPAAPDKPITGREALAAAFSQRPATVVTFHSCTDVMVDVIDHQTATAVSRILLLTGTRDPEGGRMPVDVKPPLPGVFRDTLRLTEQGWQFAERRGSLW